MRSELEVKVRCARAVGKVVVGAALSCLLVLEPAGVAHAQETTSARLDALKELSKKGQYAEAERGAEALLAEVESMSGAESIEAAQVLDVLMDARWRGGKARDPLTREMAERAIRIKEKALGPEHPDLALSVNNLAILLSVIGEYDAARPLFERALAIREKALGPDHPDVAGTLANLGNFLRETGDYEAARPLFERSLTIFEKSLGPDHPKVALSLNGLASLSREMGDYAAARQLQERCLAIQEKSLGPEHPSVAVSLNNIGNLLSITGDYASARPYYERALAIREKALGPDHPEVGFSLNNLANMLYESGDRVAAKPLYERALKIRETAYGPDHPEVASCLYNLSFVISNEGDLAQAIALQRRALSIREKAYGPENIDVAQSLTSLAGLLAAAGDYGSARPLYERAMGIHEKAVGPNHPQVGRVLNEFALFEAREGEIESALDRALDAERISREHLRLTGRSLSERHALEYAAVRISGIDLALTLAADSLDPDSRRRVLDGLVRSRAIVFDVIAERHRAASVTMDPEVTRLAEELSSAQSYLANALVRGPGRLEPGAYRRKLDEMRVEKEKAERALAESSTSFAQDLSRAALGLDDVAANLPAGSALVAFAVSKRIDVNPNSPVRIESADVYSPSYPRFYLAFVLRAGERDPFVVDLGGAETIDAEVASWRTEVSGEVLHAGRSLEEFETNCRTAGETLRKAIWDPLLPALGGVDRVFVVPDGSLNLVNLAALPVEDGGYLIERGPIVHIVSAERDLVPGAGVSRGDGLLAIGKPDYDATAMFASLGGGGAGKADGSGAKAADPILIACATTFRGPLSDCAEFSSMRFSPLPGTGKEAKEVVRLWDGQPKDDCTTRAEPLFLHDAEASETALKWNAPGHRVLHLATHGFFLGGDCAPALEGGRGIGGLKETPIESASTAKGPATSAQAASAPVPAAARAAGSENPLLLSGLVLAGANHRSAARENEDDGILTAEEIASLDLSGVEWAVLSACETGVGDIRVGEGVFGLRRAFQIAGAGTLIMSLWSVDDESTKMWMKSLYEARLIDQLDTSASVHRASLSVLQQRRARHQSTHPFFWAAFVAAGDWR